jgi:hypothetical protein
MHISPQLRPLSLGDLFDAAFRLYRARFWTLVAIAALVYVPTTLLRSVVWTALFGYGLFGSFSPFSPFSMSGIYASSFITGALWSLTLGNLLHGALVNASARAYLGQPIAPISAFAFGVRRYITLVLASFIPLIASSVSQLIPSLLGALPYYLFFGVFLTGPALGFQSWLRDLPIVLLCLAALVLLELGLLAFSSYFLLVPQAVILEDNRPIAALSRSWGLVRGSVRRALLIVIATGILSFLVATVPSTIGTLLFRFFGAHMLLFTLLFSVVGLAGQLLLQPLLFTIFTLFYYDQRIRKEGYDIEVMAQQAALP